MKKKLRPMGNSWGFVTTKTMLEHMEVNPLKDEVEILFDDKTIILKKAEDKTK